jgi:hypothetical protein
MIKPVLKIAAVAAEALGGFLKKKKDSDRIKEDKELAEALRNGDMATVARIREKRDKYKNASILIFFLGSCLMVGTVSGCLHGTDDIVLTEGSIAYILPPGKYVDNKGVTHVEDKPRVSASEADYFRNSQKIDQDKPFDWASLGFVAAGTLLGTCIWGIRDHRRRKKMEANNEAGSRQPGGLG